MSWAYGDYKGKPIGYAVEASCEHPGCEKKIDRGLSFVCGDMHGDDEYSCSGYFCEDHRRNWVPTGEGHPFRVCDKCYDTALACLGIRQEGHMTWTDLNYPEEMTEYILDMVVEDFDSHFQREAFTEANLYLAKLDPAGADHDILIGVLSATYAAADLLPSREFFYHRVYREIRRSKSEKETAELLAGLAYGSRRET